MLMTHGIPIYPVTSSHPYNHHYRYGGKRASRQGADPRAEKSEFRKPEFAEYKQIITQYVEHAGSEDYPHRGGSVGRTVCHLLETVEHCHRKQRSQKYQEIRTCYGEKAPSSCPEPVKKEIKHPHQQREGKREYDVDLKRTTQRASRLLMIPLPYNAPIKG